VSGRKKHEHHTENVVKAHRSALIALGLSLGLSLVVLGSAPVMADGFTKCTKAPKKSWKPASAAEAAAKAAGYDVRKSKIEGTCYEVYGVKGGKLFEVFYNPVDLKVMHIKAK
jgi:hypothetical protein